MRLQHMLAFMDGYIGRDCEGALDIIFCHERGERRQLVKVTCVREGEGRWLVMAEAADGEQVHEDKLRGAIPSAVLHEIMRRAPDWCRV